MAHAPGVPEESETGRPELACAATVYCGPATTAVPGAADVNVMVCDPFPTENDWRCGTASANSDPSPLWPASITHVPTPTNVTVMPETLHTDGMPDEKETVSPDGEASAPTTYGGAPTTPVGGGG